MTAPRGKGVEHLVSDLAALSTGAHQTISGRGTPWSNVVLPKTRSNYMEDKRGTHKKDSLYIKSISSKVSVVIRLVLLLIIFVFYLNHHGNFFNIILVNKIISFSFKILFSIII